MHGEGLSGACLEISGDGKLLDATVAGKKLKTPKSIKQPPWIIWLREMTI